MSISICKITSCLNIDDIKGMTIIRNIRTDMKRIMSLIIPLFSTMTTLLFFENSLFWLTAVQLFRGFSTGFPYLKRVFTGFLYLISVQAVSLF